MKVKNCIRLLFAAILVTVINSLSFSQIVNFSAFDKVEGSKITLDSIKIQNQSLKKDTILIGANSFDLNLLSDVESETSKQSELFSISNSSPNYFESKTRFVIGMPNASTLTLTLRNILGQTLFVYQNFQSSGKYTFLLEGSSLISGIYFISASDGSSLTTLKLIKLGDIGSSGPTISLVNTIYSSSNQKFSFIQSSQYNFIGFAKGYRNDTISNISPKDNSLIEFQMLKKSIREVVSGEFSLTDAKALVDWSSENWESTFNHYDTTIYGTHSSDISFSLKFVHNNFKNMFNGYHCLKFYLNCELYPESNKKDSLSLFYGYDNLLNDGSNALTCTSYNLVLTFDTTSDKIIQLMFNSSNLYGNCVYFGGSSVSYKKIKFSLKDVIFNDTQNGIFSIELKGSEILNYLQYFEQHTESGSFHFNVGNKSTETFKKFTDFSNAVLKINLYTY